MSWYQVEKGKERTDEGDDGSDKVGAKALPQTDLETLVEKLQEMTELLKRVVDGKALKGNAPKTNTQEFDDEMLRIAATKLANQMPTKDNLEVLCDCFLAIAGIGSNYGKQMPESAFSYSNFFNSTFTYLFSDWARDWLDKYGKEGTLTVTIGPDEVSKMDELKIEWDKSSRMQEAQKTSNSNKIETRIKTKLWPSELGGIDPDSSSADWPVTKDWKLTETTFCRANLQFYNLTSENEISNEKMHALNRILDSNQDRVGVSPPWITVEPMLITLGNHVFPPDNI
jgi:hypothetical protein